MCIEMAVTKPPFPREPRTGCYDGVRPGPHLAGHSPPVEPGRGRPRIAPVRSGHMLQPVVEDVRRCSADLPRRAERPRVIAVAPDPRVTSENAVHRLRDAHREPLAPAHEALGAVGFDEQVQMICLHTE